MGNWVRPSGPYLAVPYSLIETQEELKEMTINALKPEQGVKLEENDTTEDNRGFAALDSNIYDAVVDVAYFDKSDVGSDGLRVVFKEENSGKILRHTFWVTTDKADGNKTTRTNKKGQKYHIAGYTKGDAFCQVAAGMRLWELTVEERTLDLYSFDTGTYEPTKKPVAVDLLGAKVKLGLIKTVANKRTNMNGEWKDTNEVKEDNRVDKIFHADGTTSTEHAAGEPAKFIDEWRNKFVGKTDNTFKNVPGAPGADTPPSNTPAPEVENLFA